MRAFERNWAVSILRAFADAAPPARPMPISDAEYLAGIDALRRRATLLGRVGVRLAVWIIALAPVFVERSLRTFAQLDLARKHALLERLLAHPTFAVREAAFALKVAACLALFRNDEVRGLSGYDPPSRPAVTLGRGRP